MVLFFDHETQNDFCRQVEKYVEKWKVSYMDAIINICEAKGIPIESMGKVLSKPLIEKLREEGENLNFLPRSTKLPI